ncbi:hypothetical protein A8B75_19160 [Sphingomonadales bacterium EhC05]|nr:hypothetical protein A8B75_19160 [Sphingomonadales bacterium EhC05]
MNFIGKLVLFCLLMGLLQKAVEVLIVIFAIAWIYGAIVKPAETFGLLFLLTLASCIRAYPGWSLAGLMVIGIVVCVCNAKEQEPNR